jgi:SAM-dependent methyltransferase
MTSRFDAYGETYDAVVQDSINFAGLKHEFFLSAKAQVLDRILEQRGMAAASIQALDIGCGVGALHRHLAGKFASLAGCDTSAESIRRATSDRPWVEYRVCGSTHLPYADGSFDLAFASCVVHHVPPPRRPSFFSEIRRVLRPDGLGVVIEHNPFNPATRLAVYRCPFDDDAVLITAGATARAFRAAGMSDPRSEFILLSPFQGKVAMGLERAFSSMPLGAQYACSAVA